MIADILVSGTMWGFMWTFFMLVIVTAVVLSLAGLLRARGSRPPHTSALRILEERYARGEIAREEFLERRAVLLGKGADRSPRG